MISPGYGPDSPLSYQSSVVPCGNKKKFSDALHTKSRLLEAWLALTSVKYHGNL